MNKKIIICLLLIACLCFVVLLNINEGFKDTNEESQTTTSVIKESNNELNKKLDKALKMQNKKKEKNTKIDKTSIRDMLESLEQSEEMCSELERKQTELNNKRLLEAQKRKLSEIELQEARIIQLTEILKNLKLEKKKKDMLYEQCDSKIQEGINDNYSAVQTLVRNGLGNESINLNLDLTNVYKNYLDGQNDKIRQKKHLEVEKKIDKINSSRDLNDKNDNDKKKMINKLKQNLNLKIEDIKNDSLKNSNDSYKFSSNYINTKKLDRCHNCDSKKINKKKDQIIKDFKNFNHH